MLESRALGIRGRLALLIVLAVAPVALLGAGAVVSFLVEEMRQSRLRSVSGEVMHAAAVLDASWQSARDDVIFLSLCPPIGGIIRARVHGGVDPQDGDSLAKWHNRLDRIFVAMADANKVYDEIRFLDRDGMELVRVDLQGGRGAPVPAGSLENERDDRAFSETVKLVKGQVSFSPLDPSGAGRSIGTPHGTTITVATPVFDDAGRLQGVVALSVLLDEVVKLSVRRIRHLVDTVFVADESGRYAYRAGPPGKERGGPKDLETSGSVKNDYPADWPAVLGGKPEGVPIGDRHVLTGLSRPWPGEGRYLVVGVELPDSALVQGLPEALAVIAAATVLVLLAVLLVTAWPLGRSITRPLLALVDTVDRFRNGDLSARAAVTREDEIGRLSEAFNGMADRIAGEQRLLEAKVLDRTARLEESRRAALCVLQDANELRRRAEQTAARLAASEKGMEQAKEAADAANRAKSAFLASISHEIRTPMNAVLGFAQLLAADPSLRAVQRERVSTILRAGFSLLELVDEVLDVAKIEAGRMTLQPATFDLHALIRDLEALFRSRAEAMGLRLLVERDDELPRFVVGDEGKVRRVLTNLLGNAVKFTAQGGVALRIRANAEEFGQLRLVAEVADTGPGIALADQGRLFAPFDQTEAGERAGGSGLGLAISRQLARLMGGDVTLASEPGAGSRFRFEAVVGRGDAGDAVEPKTSRRVVRLRDGTPPTRVLAVDDNEDNRRLLRELLTRAGFEVREATSGREALERFEVFRPHLVLMDMRMPDMDGYEATRRLKSTEAGRTTPVVAVTATAFEDGRQRVLDAGADAYVRKPFRAEKLFAILSRFLGVEYVYAGEGAEAGGESPRPPSSPPLSREQVAALPAEVRARMQAAVIRGDVEAVLALLARVEADDAVMASMTTMASVASGLRRLAESYEYERLIELLGGEGTGEGRS